MEVSRVDEEKIASKLKGNTLRVYWHLVRSPNNPVGPREIQRRFGFSSPALAVYHLEKLAELGLIQKTRGEYRLVKVVNVGVLKQFARAPSDHKDLEEKIVWCGGLKGTTTPNMPPSLGVFEGKCKRQTDTGRMLELP